MKIKDIHTQMQYQEAPLSVCTDSEELGQPRSFPLLANYLGHPLPPPGYHLSKSRYSIINDVLPVCTNAYFNFIPPPSPSHPSLLVLVAQHYFMVSLCARLGEHIGVKVEAKEQLLVSFSRYLVV